MKQKICNLDDLNELSAKEFNVKKDNLEKEAFLVRFKEGLYAFENSCPHTGVTLNWQEEQFFSFDGRFLQCSLHGALFEPTDGLCVRGPCQGESLKTIDIVVEDRVIYLK